MSLNTIRKISRKDIRSTLLVGAILLILIIGLSVYYRTNSESNFVSVEPYDWSYSPGANISNDRVHFKPIGRVITHKDTSAAQPNPLINIRGPHLLVQDDFQIEVSMSGVHNGATLDFFGKVPSIFDEWRQEHTTLRIVLDSYGAKMRVWDGSSPNSIDERVYQIDLEDSEKLIISHKAEKIEIGIGNIVLGSIPNHNIFSSGEVWFGSDSILGTEGWSINYLKARSLSDKNILKLEPPDLSKQYDEPDSLRNLAKANHQNIPIGAAVAINPLFSDEQYRKIALSQFSILTIENSMKPQFIQPQKGLYIFQDADGVVEAAQKNNMLVHGHSLVMGKANPQWMQTTPEDERKQVMTDHISKVVGHYKGKVAEWDVVNEPLSEDDIDYSNEMMGLRKQIWYDGMGESYIDQAFVAAKQADPSAKLYLNDYGLEKDGKRWDALVSLIQRLKSRGVPIDGVGFEAHVYHEPDFIDPAVLKKHIQILAGMGIVSRISEIDVLGDNESKQSEQYAIVLSACLSEPSCTSYTTWGITDLYGSTTLSDRYPTKYGDSLLWSTKYEPKPALRALQDVLRKQAP